MATHSADQKKGTPAQARIQNFNLRLLICRIWYSISPKVSDNAHRGELMVRPMATPLILEMRYEQAFVWVATIVVVLMVRHDRLNDRGCLEGSSLAGASARIPEMTRGWPRAWPHSRSRCGQSAGGRNRHLKRRLIDHPTFEDHALADESQ
jgi:hypothetical protein